jgi:hypothetical protein
MPQFGLAAPIVHRFRHFIELRVVLRKAGHHQDEAEERRDEIEMTVDERAFISAANPGRRYAACGSHDTTRLAKSPSFYPSVFHAGELTRHVGTTRIR